MSEIRIYFEGNKALREGFREFLRGIRDRARAARIGFELVACDATPAADFKDAVKKHPNAWNILLRDSEGKGLPKRPRANEFWMVEVMESWFLADPEALTAYYGAGFKSKALKKNPDVESIPKGDVLSCLKRATKSTRKRKYHKVQHAPEILARIDPAKVRGAAQNCERLFAAIIAKLEA